MNEYVAALLGMMLLAAGGGWFISARKPVEKPVKVMLFVLYFWLLVFLQVALFALGYFLLDKFS
ncbi:hypothetical protein Q9L42_011960 [Methylomarinum sp. Ch1-1]|uniref:Uncharacterized protein n=1 Tax=Methylomarinum roseum TaxID=3067653 RepID=A0AAU7NQ35_9GAMM|nr:hypothetical protein [Methylomarinum sp. Ch1-1]MDP4520984.1 hypothetical protein [Methylomarinum sp. Ch1-1]